MTRYPDIIEVECLLRVHPEGITVSELVHDIVGPDIGYEFIEMRCNISRKIYSLCKKGRAEKIGAIHAQGKDAYIYRAVIE